MLRLSDLKHTRVYQEGQEDEGLKIALFQLTCRFGEIDPNLQAQIRQLSLPQVEALLKALLNFAGLKDLTDWLQQNPPARL